MWKITLDRAKNLSRGDSPEAGEAISSAEAMAALAAVRVVFIKLRQSCGELDATPVHAHRYEANDATNNN